MGKKYYILLEGTKIDVTKEVYYAYKRPVWREAKDRTVRKYRERSLDCMMEKGTEDFAISSVVLLEDAVVDKLILEQLLIAIGRLTHLERLLIDLLFFQGKSEREVALFFRISSVAVHKRKCNIIKKLRKALDE